MTLSEETKSGLKVGAVIATCVSAYCLGVWAPLSREIMQTQSEIDDCQEKLDRANRVASRLSKIQKEVALLNQMAADSEKRFPKTRPGPGDIEAVESLARKDGVTLVDIASSKSRVTQYFIENSFEITGSASYESFHRLLADLALEERLMEVREFRLTPQGHGSSQAAFKLIFYQYKS